MHGCRRWKQMFYIPCLRYHFSPYLMLLVNGNKKIHHKHLRMDSWINNERKVQKIPPMYHFQNLTSNKHLKFYLCCFCCALDHAVREMSPTSHLFDIIYRSIPPFHVASKNFAWHKCSRRQCMEGSEVYENKCAKNFIPVAKPFQSGNKNKNK